MKTQFTVTGDEVKITYPDGEIRSYRTVGREHGYVYDVTDRPGTTGDQVFDPRAPRGTTLTGPKDGDRLAGLLRRCLRSARGKAARSEYEDPADVRL